MEVAIRKMGNSQGALIPKPILAQVGLEGTANLQMRDGAIEIRANRRNSRDGWAADARRQARQGGDVLASPELANAAGRLGLVVKAGDIWLAQLDHHAGQ